MAHPPRIGVVVSSVAGATPTQSTIHLIVAALHDGYAVEVIEPWDFEIDEQGRPSARAHRLDPNELGAGITREQLVELLRQRQAPRRSVRLQGQTALLLRTNPLNGTILSFAQLAEATGVPVRNRPGDLLRASHKAWLATLTDVPRPRTLITRALSAVERFASACDGVVLKPARASGGRGVSLVHGQAGLEDALQAAIRAGDGYVVVQEYLPAASAGERRLLYLRGAGLLGGYLRVRAPGEFRHNLRLGAEPVPCPADVRDGALIAALAPHLDAAGVYFAGIDVIDGRVIEVNTLNPGGIHYTAAFTGLPIAHTVMKCLVTPPSLQETAA